MSIAKFIKDALHWRITGGHAADHKLMGITSSPVDSNTALTDLAYPLLTSGVNNTAIGVGALSHITSGSNNFAIGKNSGSDALANLQSTSNNGVLGNNSTTIIYSKVALTVTSDERDKSEFTPIPWTLEDFAKVKTGQFYWKDRTYAILSGKARYGLSAQNLKTIEDSVGSKVLVDDANAEHLKIHETMMIPILVKMVQDLHSRVQILEAQQAKQG